MREAVPLFATIFQTFDLRIRKFFIFSLLVHALLPGVIGFRPFTAKISLPAPSSIYSVNLVSAPADAPSVDSPKKQETYTSFDPARLAAISGVFAKSRASVKTDAALEEIRKRVNTKTDAGAAAVSKAEKEQVSDLLAEYYSRIGGGIKANWKIPQWVVTHGEMETVIVLRILRDGSLAYAAFERSSGNHHLDESAMRAVQKSAPFQPLPDWVKDDHLDIGIRFNPREIQ